MNPRCLECEVSPAKVHAKIDGSQYLLGSGFTAHRKSHRGKKQNKKTFSSLHAQVSNQCKQQTIQASLSNNFKSGQRPFLGYSDSPINILII